MLPNHPPSPAEQQFIVSAQAIMAAGRDTARYGALLVEATLAAVEGKVTPSETEDCPSR